jgi:transcriptional regulator with XRE-family HTH domain
MSTEEPASIADLMKRALRARRMSQRAAAMYMGVSYTAVSNWITELRVPDPDSCQKLARWSGYPFEFVMQLAGHLPSAGSPPGPGMVEVIPELGVLLRHFSPEEQRQWVLPATRLALELRENRAPFDPKPDREE